MDRASAQARLDRIRVFRSELADLERAGVVVIDERQRQAVDAHYQHVLADLTSRFDLDRDEGQRRMSVGMRIASVVGAAALSAAIFLFFYRIWGWISTPLQVGVLVAAPLAAIGATETAARLDRTRHFVFLAAVIACACIVINVVMVGQIFAMTDSPAALAVFAAFGLLIGNAYGLRLPLAGGLLAAVAFIAGTANGATGASWNTFVRLPETWIPAAMVVIAAGTIPPAAASTAFAPTYRVIGAGVVLVALWFLSINEYFSLLPWSSTVVKAAYQLLGFATAAATTIVGLRQGWSEWTYLGAAGLMLFLYTKFYQWFWDWMPAYVFFLIVGLVAVSAIVALRSMRAIAAGDSR